MQSPRILLCIPHGGLNDTLCQIEKCRDYAARHGRDLYIDTRRSGLMADFDNFFEFSAVPKVKCITRVDEETAAQLRLLRTFPAVLTGRIGKYANRYCAATNRQVDFSTNSVLSFDFDVDYSEALIVHEQHGGGQLSHQLMPFLKLSGQARAFVIASLADLPPVYDAVHIRNTDYKTDYVRFLEKMKERLSHRFVLVCSDDPEVFRRAQSILTNSRVFAVTKSAQMAGQPLHHSKSYNSAEARIAATMRSLVDLLALAGSENLFFTHVESGVISGFSELAAFLHENRKVARSLLGPA